MKRALVVGLERLCNRLHFVFHHRPWTWLPLPHCPLAELSDRLDRRWATGVWTTPGKDRDDG